jgi:hypothetical protein
VNSDWAGQEFQESLTALSLWHEAHTEGNTLRWFLDAYSWAHDNRDQRHDRTHVWEGPQGQPHDQPRGLKWTVDRVIAYANRRLLHADLEPGTNPNVFGLGSVLTVELGSFLGFQTVSKSPHLSAWADPLWVTMDEDEEMARALAMSIGGDESGGRLGSSAGRAQHM